MWNALKQPMVRDVSFDLECVTAQLRNYNDIDKQMYSCNYFMKSTTCKFSYHKLRLK